MLLPIWRSRRSAGIPGGQYILSSYTRKVLVCLRVLFGRELPCVLLSSRQAILASLLSQAAVPESFTMPRSRGFIHCLRRAFRPLLLSSSALRALLVELLVLNVRRKALGNLLGRSQAFMCSLSALRVE